MDGMTALLVQQRDHRSGNYVGFIACGNDDGNLRRRYFRRRRSHHQGDPPEASTEESEIDPDGKRQGSGSGEHCHRLYGAAKTFETGRKGGNGGEAEDNKNRTGVRSLLSRVSKMFLC